MSIKVRMRQDLLDKGYDVIATAKFYLTQYDIESATFLGSDDVTGEVVLELPGDWLQDESPIVRVDSIDLEFIEEGGEQPLSFIYASVIARARFRMDLLVLVVVSISCLLKGDIMEKEDTLFGADGTEVLWFSEITQEMIDKASLNEEAIAELFDELNEAVASICQNYGVQ